MAESNDKLKIEEELKSVFAFSTPIQDPKLFSGRQALLENLRPEINTPGINFLLYGEAGVGKTSFYNVLFYNSDKEVYRCSEDDNFVIIFLTILHSRGISFKVDELVDTSKEGLKIGSEKLFLSLEESIELAKKYKPVAEQKLDTNFVISKLKKLDKNLVIILDEFHRLKQQETKWRIIDVIKAIADESVNVQFVIVGTSKSDREILDIDNYPHQKDLKQRNFFIEEIPRMNFNELVDIINVRKNLFGMKFRDPVKFKIAEIASGYPATLHRIAYNCTVECLAKNIEPIVSNAVKKFIGWITRKPSDEIILKKYDWDIKEDHLVHGLKRYLGNFASRNKPLMETFKKVLNSDDKDTLKKLLLYISKSDNDELQLEDIASHINKNKDWAKNIIENDMNSILVKVSNCYKLASSQLRSCMIATYFLIDLGVDIESVISK